MINIIRNPKLYFILTLIVGMTVIFFGCEGPGGAKGDVGDTGPVGPEGPQGPPGADANEIYISVIDFGAMGDGITDDTAALKSALTAAVGKTLYIPAGTYMLTPTINLTQVLSIIGDGVDATILRVLDSFDYTTLVIYEKIVIKADSINNLFISNLTIDGNFSSETKKTCGATLKIRGCSNVIIDRVKIINSYAHNMEITKSKYVYVEHCSFDYATDDGLSISDGRAAGENKGDTGSEHIYIKECIAGENIIDAGFEIDDGPQHVVFEDCISLRGFSVHRHPGEVTPKNLKYVRCKAGVGGRFSVESVSTGNETENNFFENITFEDCFAENGFWFSQFKNLKLINCDVINPDPGINDVGRQSFRFRAGLAQLQNDGLQIIGCTSIGSGGNGFYFESTKNIIISDCISALSNQWGFHVRSVGNLVCENILISSCLAYDNNEEESTSYSGGMLIVSDNSIIDGVSIIGCRAFDDRNPKKQYRGIYLNEVNGGIITRAVVVNNNAYDNVAENILINIADQSTVVVANNIESK